MSRFAGLFGNAKTVSISVEKLLFPIPLTLGTLINKQKTPCCICDCVRRSHYWFITNTNTRKDMTIKQNIMETKEVFAECMNHCRENK